MQRRIGTVTLVVVGVALIVGTLAFQMFSRAPAYERMTNDFQKNVNPTTVAALQADVTKLQAAGTELQTKGIPTLAAMLKISPEQFAALAQQRFPALAASVQQIPQTAASFDKLLGVIATQDAHLRSAAAIPAKNISTTVLPWIILGIGVVVVGLALARTRTASMVAVAVGALTIIGVFAFSMPSKTSAADALNKAMKPYFTQQEIDASHQSLASLDTLSGELTGKVLSAIAAVQHVPPSQLIGPFTSQFPAMTSALIALPDATDRANTLLATFQRNLADYNKVAPFHFLAATREIAAAGLLIMVGGAVVVFISDEAAASEDRMRHAAVA
ncbi:MAG TPA: hypothetical protein VJ818_08700 [Actinomycetota bacterium]|nr:hypothetical protein [Actinomycetota bacterium]